MFNNKILGKVRNRFCEIKDKLIYDTMKCGNKPSVYNILFAKHCSFSEPDLECPLVYPIFIGV